MRKVLIAGCGYVGSQLAADYVAAGDSTVYCLSRRPPPLPGTTPLAFDMLVDATDGLPRGIDTLVFAAAPGGGDAAAYEAIYGEALRRMLAYLRAHGAPGARLVLTSSTSVYGQCQGEWVDEDSATTPQSAASHAIVRAEASLGPRDIAVRFGGIYGPGRTRFIDSVRDGTLRVHPTQSAFTNRIHRDDAAASLRFVAALAAPAAVYNGVDLAPAPQAEVAAWMAEQLGVALNWTDGAAEASFLRGNKRVRSDRLVGAGYRFIYPTYREGYGALLAAARRD